MTYGDRDKLLQALGYESYQTYLASELWAAIKNECQYKLGKKCSICQRAYRVYHHLNYLLETLLGNDLTGLTPLCMGCHKKVEFNGAGSKRNLEDAQRTYMLLLAGHDPRRLSIPRRRRVSNLTQSKLRTSTWRGSKRKCSKCGQSRKKGTDLCGRCKKLLRVTS